MRRVEEYAETLYRVLPATTRADIQRKMRGDWPGITIATIDGVLHWVRKHPDMAGFNVAYVKRGIPDIGDDNRFFVINKDDPSFKFTDNQRSHFDNGCASTILGLETFSKNVAEMLETAQVHESLRVKREYLADMQEVAAFCSRRMKRLYTMIQEKNAA